MSTLKEVERIYKPFDWVGWIMSLLGLVMITYFSGLFGNPPDWWFVGLSVLVFWEYAVRVAYGRLCTYIYYDTILHPMYELDIEGNKYFVNALNVEELNLYMDIHYPDMKYKIIDETHTESFIKTKKTI
jgi:hypothetical protein